MENVAQIINLSIAFKGEKSPIIAVEDINLTLRAGETLGLMGESGCGKSITSLGIMRLLPPNSLYGINSKVLFANHDLLDLPEKLMRCIRGKRIAMIFQEPMTALNPVLTIGQQIEEALTEHHKLLPDDIYSSIIALLEEVEIPQPELRIKQYPHQLSGGQKQRVIIAMALACEPEVLIADEPTTALDVTIQAQILILIKKLQEKRQMSLLLITHDLAVIKAMAHYVCVMYAGQVVETAKVDQFFLNPYILMLNNYSFLYPLLVNEIIYFQLLKEMCLP
jgi:peptide/nickel transport system ATP-binding protein